MKSPSKLKIVIPQLDLIIKPKNGMNPPAEPIVTFSSDLVKGIEILHEEMSRIFPPGTTYSEPPAIPSLRLEEMLPPSTSALLLDCLESAILKQFEKHRTYNKPNRPHYEKKLMKPPPVKSEMLIASCEKQLGAWIQYPDKYGTDINRLLVETVKEEAKSYCDLKEDLAKVKLEMVDSIFSDLLNDTVDCLFTISK